jgi:hypothetical protein
VFGDFVYLVYIDLCSSMGTLKRWRYRGKWRWHCIFAHGQPFLRMSSTPRLWMECWLPMQTKSRMSQPRQSLSQFTLAKNEGTYASSRPSHIPRRGFYQASQKLKRLIAMEGLFYIFLWYLDNLSMGLVATPLEEHPNKYVILATSIVFVWILT